jgi:ubiquitin C-terminal hydrolase
MKLKQTILHASITQAMESQQGGGLINMGLTCYGNAVIQNLRHLSKLTWLLEEGKYNTLFKGDAKPQRALSQNLTKALAEVIQFLGKCKKGQSVRPGNFWNNLVPAVRDTLYEQFAMKTFHDSHEFYQLVIETIHQSTIQDVDMKIIRPPPTTARDHLIHGALAAWQQAFSKEYSPLIHMFYGMYHQKTTCQKCKNVSHRWESFNSLKIPISVSQEPCDIMQSLKDDLLHEEVIDEYECENCGKPRPPAKKTMTIWKLPLVLVLSVKRFQNNGLKIGTPVAPVSTVDFTPYFSEDSPEREVKVQYTLRGMVDHHGSSLGGHYTAQCLSTTNGAWHRFDDESVYPMPNPEFGQSTYMLFMERS